MYTLKKNSLGFYQVDPMPDEEELQAYYSEKYYQAPVVKTYALNYTEEDFIKLVGEDGVLIDIKGILDFHRR